MSGRCGHVESRDGLAPVHVPPPAAHGDVDGDGEVTLRDTLATPGVPVPPPVLAARSGLDPGDYVGGTVDTQTKSTSPGSRPYNPLHPPRHPTLGLDRRQRSLRSEHTETGDSVAAVDEGDVTVYVHTDRGSEEARRDALSIPPTLRSGPAGPHLGETSTLLSGYPSRPGPGPPRPPPRPTSSVLRGVSGLGSPFCVTGPGRT